MKIHNFKNLTSTQKRAAVEYVKIVDSHDDDVERKKETYSKLIEASVRSRKKDFFFFADLSERYERELARLLETKEDLFFTEYGRRLNFQKFEEQRNRVEA